MPRPPALKIRPARAGDVPAIVALLADDPLGRTREEPGDAGAYRRAFAAMSRHRGNRLLVGERDGAVVGCLQLTIIPGLSRRGMTRGLVEGVRVAPGARGGGIGEALLRRAIDLAKAAGCGLVELTTDAARVDAHRFYERLGFAASHVGFKLLLD